MYINMQYDKERLYDFIHFKPETKEGLFCNRLLAKQKWSAIEQSKDVN